MELVTIEEVRAAARRVAPVIQVTPAESSRAIGEVFGAPVTLKCENLQRTGSFKVRGALNRIAGLSDDERARGVVCASAGNHGQGVALAASLEHVPAVVYMPREAPLPKVEATRAYGAEVRLLGDGFEDALAEALAEAEELGRVLVHPFDHRDVIAGQGTLALEILEQVPDVATVVAGVGGGGLVSGLAVALRALRPEVRIVGVQAAGCAAMEASLRAGHVVTLGHAETVADGIAVRRPGELTLAHVQALVDDVVTVTDEELAHAVVVLLERAKLVTEPAGAAGVAALLGGRIASDGPTVAVVSGGNVDPLLLQHLATTDLATQGRYATLRTRVEDVPGSLSRLLQVVADARANVLGVSHHRLQHRLGLGRVEVVLELETRGVEHVRAIRRTLEQAGFPTV